jgi:hypothetical protein
LIQNNIKNEDIILDASIILSAYGLREARDTDFFCINNKSIKHKLDLIETHDEALIYHGLEKIDLLYNQRNYFYFNDFDNDCCWLRNTIFKYVESVQPQAILVISHVKQSFSQTLS